MLDDGWEDGAGERRAEVTPPEAAATEVAAAVKGVSGDMGTPAAGLNGEKGSVPWEAAAAWVAAAAWPTLETGRRTRRGPPHGARRA